MRLSLEHNERPWRLPLLRHDSGCVWVVPLGPRKLVICERHSTMIAIIEYSALVIGACIGTALGVLLS